MTPSAPTLIKIRRADGTIYEARFRGFTEDGFGGEFCWIDRPCGDGWTTGLLRDGETILTTPKEHR